MDHLHGLFASAAQRFPDHVAVELQRAGGVDSVRYRELAAMAARVARWLLDQGCVPGDRVALLADNDARWCGAFLGIAQLGAVAVPLDTAYKPEQIATLLEDSGARLVVVGPRQLAPLREALPRIRSTAAILLLHGSAAGADSLEEILGSQSAPPSLPACPATRSDPAAILYTSGTTADPKGVVLTHGNLLAEREGAFAVIRVDERDAVLSVLPLFHALALLANLLLPLAVGARVVFLESVNTGEMLRAFRERGISAFCCVPQFYYLVHKKVLDAVAAAGPVRRALFRVLLALNGRARRSLRLNLGPLVFRAVHRTLGPRMRLLITGGSRFDPGVARDLHALGFDVLEAYGLTECSGAATLTRPGAPPNEGVGAPLPGVEVRIDADEPGREGEILIRGPIVMAGYFHRPDANAETLRDGWLRTGDLGLLDAEGKLRVTGRKKEVIVLASGKNIYPEEIEAHYSRAPSIKEICVLGLARAGEPSAERLHAVVVPDLAAARERKMIHLREQLRWEIEGLSVELPGHKRILSYDVTLTDLPRTTTRKLKRHEIERRVRERRPEELPDGGAPSRSPEDSAWLEDPHVAGVLAVLGRRLSPGAPVFPSANIELDLGLDSMERVELLTDLEHELGVRVPEETAHGIYTVRELVEALRTAPPASAAAEGGSRPAAPAWDRILGDVPEDDPSLAELLRPKTPTALAAFVVLRLAHLAARPFLRLRASGVEHLPEGAPFILSPNHQTYLDGLLVAGVLPFRVFRRIFLVGTSDWFATPIMARLARAINIVPVDPDAHLVRAMKASAHGLRNGKVLILFPEGELTIDGTVRPFRKGASILASHLRVPVVPVAIHGAYDIWPRGRGLRWRALLPGGGPGVRIRFGPPLSPAHPDAAADPERDYATTTERLRRAVQELWSGLRERSAR